MGFACGAFVSPGYITTCKPKGGGRTRRYSDVAYWQYPTLTPKQLKTARRLKQSFSKFIDKADTEQKQKLIKVIRPFAKVQDKQDPSVDEIKFKEIVLNLQIIEILQQLFYEIVLLERRREEEEVIQLLLIISGELHEY